MGARDRDLNDIAFIQAFHGHIRAGQRRSVVGLAGRRGGNRQLLRASHVDRADKFNGKAGLLAGGIGGGGYDIIIAPALFPGADFKPDLVAGKQRKSVRHVERSGAHGGHGFPGVRAVPVGEDGRGEHRIPIDQFHLAAVKIDAELQRLHRQFAQIFTDRVISLLRGAPIEGIGICRFADLGNGAVGGRRRPFPVHQAGDGGFAVRQGLAVVNLFGCAGGDGDRGGGHLQGAQFLRDDVVSFLCVAPFDFIGVFAFAHVGLAAGCGHGDLAVNRRGNEFRFLAVQGPAVVVGDGGVDIDMHVGEIRQQAIRLVFHDPDAVLLHHLGGRVRFQAGNQRLYVLFLPAGFLAGLLQSVGILGINAQQFFGKIGQGNGFRFVFQAFPAFFVVQVDDQPVSGLQLHVAGFAGEGVHGVHHHHAAHAVKRLIFQRGIDEIRHIPRGGRLRAHAAADPARRGFPFGDALGFEAAPDGDTRLRIGQRRAVVDFFRAAGDNGDRHRLHDQLAVDFFHVGKMAGHIFVPAVINLVIAHGIFALSRVDLNAGGGNRAPEF